MPLKTPEVLERLHGRLIVSCQASPGDPMEDIETLRRVARSAAQGGAEGLRLNSPEVVRAVRLDTTLPIIAIQKSYTGGRLRITPDFASARALADAGADVIALDCTGRLHAHGEPWREILERIHRELGLLVMADIATLHEGVIASTAGADLVGTTLNGYTEETAGQLGFGWGLLDALIRETGRPVVAEGHIATPDQAVRALDAGAWCVVVGSAITRPGTIAEKFRKAVDRSRTPAEGGRYAIGLDIGGTSIKSGLVNERGELTALGKTPTQASGGRAEIAHSTHLALRERLLDASTAGIEIVGVGVATAGAIDAAAGRVFAATDNLPGWAGFDIRSSLRELTTLPVFVENDAHAAALAELHFGVGRQFRSFVAVTIGTGVGGGVVIDGRLVRGKFGFAGTVGHQTIRFDGLPCNCGRHGCLETYVSAAALVREYEARAGAITDARPPEARAMHVAELAAAGDPSALEAYAALARYLAEGVANLANLLDPEAVILSGGVVEGRAGFADEVQAETQKLLHFGAQRPPRILTAQAGHSAGVQGAAAAVFEGLR